MGKWKSSPPVPPESTNASGADTRWNSPFTDGTFLVSSTGSIPDTAGPVMTIVFVIMLIGPDATAPGDSKALFARTEELLGELCPGSPRIFRPPFGAIGLGGGVIQLSLYLVALTGMGMLATTGVVVSEDTFGPVADNAAGIAEMSGEFDGEAERNH